MLSALLLQQEFSTRRQTHYPLPLFPGAVFPIAPRSARALLSHPMVQFPEFTPRCLNKCPKLLFFSPHCVCTHKDMLPTTRHQDYSCPGKGRGGQDAQKSQSTAKLGICQQSFPHDFGSCQGWGEALGTSPGGWELP